MMATPEPTTAIALTDTAPDSTDRRAARLLELESVIERGLPIYVEVGLALREIRDKKLYEPKYGQVSFDSYCQKRWGFHDSRARQLIGAAEVAETLKTVTVVTLSTERIAREFVPLKHDTEALKSAAEEMANHPNPTAAVVKDIVRKTRAATKKPERKISDAEQNRRERERVAKENRRTRDKRIESIVNTFCDDFGAYDDIAELQHCDEELGERTTPRHFVDHLVERVERVAPDKLHKIDDLRNALANLESIIRFCQKLRSELQARLTALEASE